MVIKSMLLNVSGFLRKNQRTLKLSTLTLLDTVVRNYHHRLSPNTLQPVLQELPPLITDSDLHIAQLTMNLMTSVASLGMVDALRLMASSAGLQEVLKLSRSPLLQGAALSSMLDLFRAFVANGAAAGLSAHNINDALTAPVIDPESGSGVHKQGRACTAKCVAAVLAELPSDAKKTVSGWCSLIQSRKCFAHQQTFFLLAIGEIGKLQ